MRILVAALLIVIMGLSYALWHQKTDVTTGQEHPQSSHAAAPTAQPVLATTAPATPKLSPLIVSLLQQLYLNGNKLSKALDTGISRPNFEASSVELRGQIESIVKLWPENFTPDLQPYLNSFGITLALTGEVWDLEMAKRQFLDRGGAMTAITMEDNPSIINAAAMMFQNNRYGLGMLVFDGTSLSTINNPLDRIAEFKSGKLKWIVAYFDTNGNKYFELNTLLALCSKRYESLEKEMLPLVR